MTNFTKKNLKIGMIVETKENNLYMTHEFNNELVFINKCGCLKLTDYKEDLSFYDEKLEQFDIANVRKPNKVYQLTNDYWCDAPIIWERRELPKLTDIERVILENARAYGERFRWINKDKNGDIHLYVNKPEKGRANLTSIYHTRLDAYSHLFQFIKLDDNNTYSIEDLLSVEKDNLNQNESE